MRSLLYSLIFSIISVSVFCQSEAKQQADKGREYYQAKQYAKAIEQYNKALTLRPDWPIVYGFRSDAKRKNNDLKGALEDVDLFVKLDPTNYRPYFKRAVIREELKDYAGAIADYDQILAFSEKHYRVYGYRARVKQKTGDFEGMVSDYDALIQINPDLPQAYILKASALSFLEKYDEAIAQLDMAIERKPKEGSAFFKRGIYKRMLSPPDLIGSCQDLLTAKEKEHPLADDYLKRFCKD